MDNLNSILGAIHAEEDVSTSHTVHMPRSVQYDNQSNNPHNRACPSHTNESNLIREESTQQADARYINNVSGTLYGPKLTAGKRFTRVPARFCSPFKAGIMSRPPPNREASMNLWELLCADDSPFRSFANSFVDDALPNCIFMKGFVKCIKYDDYFIRPECHGYRIFFDSDISAILNVEWIKRDCSEPQYSEAAAVASIQRCLPFTNLKKTKMILLPVLHNHHWSVYCINFGQSRIDVLDSTDHMSNGDNSWELHHSGMGAKIIQRVNDALSKAAPHKFKSFKNWRHVKIEVPVHNSQADSAFYAMKFLEFYDGDGHGSLKTSLDVDCSKELRAEILYYLAFHSENKVASLPHELLQFRVSEHHPFFY